MLSDSVYNFATSRRGTSSADQDSGDSQYDPLRPANVQQPRNKRKNFKPISSRMAEVSDDESEQEVDQEDRDDQSRLDDNAEENCNDIEFERKTLRSLSTEELQRPAKRLNNNEASPMDLSVATRPPSSDDDESSDSIRHKCLLEHLNSQKLYSPSGEVRIIFTIIIIKRPCIS